MSHHSKPRQDFQVPDDLSEGLQHDTCQHYLHWQKEQETLDHIFLNNYHWQLCGSFHSDLLQASPQDSVSIGKSLVTSFCLSVVK